MSFEVETSVELKTARQLDDPFENPPIVNIKVVGVGGGGCNSVNRMLQDGIALDGVEFIAVNTDKVALRTNKAQQKLCIGQKLTRGFGAGTDPLIGQKAAEESAEEIRTALEGADLIFLTAGMGGGTGTGAAPVIASIAKELGILTVAIVTTPFDFEGQHKMLNAQAGIQNLSRYVDSYIVVPNQRLVERLAPTTGMRDAFKIADEVLREGVMGLVDFILRPTDINVDYADVRNILQGAGMAHMGLGRAKGDDRVLNSIRQAVASPLIETNINGARRVIVYIKCGEGLSLAEVSNYAMLISNLADPHCNFKYGVDLDPKYGDEVEVLIIASEFVPKSGSNVDPNFTASAPQVKEPEPEPEPKKKFPPFFKNFKNFK